MDRLFRADSPIMIALSKAADWVVLNIFTVLLSIPIITLGAAVTALYDAMGRLQRDEGGIYKAYFRAFRSNFKKATLQWLALLLIGGLLFLCLFFYMGVDWSTGRILLLVSAVLLFLWSACTAWVFPLQSRFENSVRNTLYNAVLCSIAYLPRTILMVIFNAVPWALLLLFPAVFFRTAIFFLLIWFSLAAHFNLQLLKKPFRHLTGEAPESNDPA